tara:strand:- start:2305 stop:2709 length:405 start_codon:yes stop_codon:yes gene_type:complete
LKAFFSALFGLGFSLFVEGFSRIIISFFHKQEFYFFGVGALPSPFWILIIYIVSIISTWLGTMLAVSIANKATNKAYIFSTILVSLWIVFEILSSLRMVPIWYLITFPITSILGLILARFTYTFNKTQNALSNS